MPGRLRQATGTAAADPKLDAPYIPGLQFNESLTWRAGKAIPVADLLSRLQNLSQELKALEQDQVERTAFTRVAQDLASANLIAHKDKGIRAYTACCVVDILRLCAPDAPFKNAQLKVYMKTWRKCSSLTKLRTSSQSLSTRFYRVLPIPLMRITSNMPTFSSPWLKPKASSCLPMWIMQTPSFCRCSQYALISCQAHSKGQQEARLKELWNTI